MKTTVDIPSQALQDLLKYTQVKTKREAILIAIDDYNRQRELEKVMQSFGTWDMASNEEIEELEADQ